MADVVPLFEGKICKLWHTKMGDEMKNPWEESIIYNKKEQNTESVYYTNSLQSYPMHTHAGHLAFGFVSDGEVCIVRNDGKQIYRAGNYFCIPQDTPHAIDTVNDMPYSMAVICIPAGDMPDQGNEGAYDIRRLKRLIQETPENMFLIKDMALAVSVSPYHMIRQFKAACGLTPHQFQIQCRIRKGQKLLEQGKSVTEAAHATGFCDQSHFDRCFRKIVRLTPGEYRQAAAGQQTGCLYRMDAAH